MIKAIKIEEPLEYTKEGHPEKIIFFYILAQNETNDFTKIQDWLNQHPTVEVIETGLSATGTTLSAFDDTSIKELAKLPVMVFYIRYKEPKS